VHSHDSNCIYSVVESNRDSIEFSLSIAEQRAVGFIPAWSLASLQKDLRRMFSVRMMLYLGGSDLFITSRLPSEQGHHC